jgi:predicted transposase/invertase (TIGR01784 family)
MEDFEMLPEKNPMIQEAYCKLQVMSEDEANRMIYEARLKARRDEYSRLQGARQEGLTERWQAGLTEGRKAGLTEGRQAVARSLKALGDPIEKIALATGLSVDEISAL